MTIADRPHGRSRYNAGCRCGECRAANRDHQRTRRAKHLTAVPPRDRHPAEFIDGSVTEAVRTQFEGTAIAQDRPGVFAIAIRLAQLLDDQTAVPQYSSASRVLTDIIATLSRQSRGPGRLRAVRSMTERD